VHTPRRRATLDEQLRGITTPSDADPAADWWRKIGRDSQVVTFFIPRAEPVGFEPGAFDHCLGHLRLTQYRLVAAANQAVTPISRQMLPIGITAWTRNASQPNARPTVFTYFLGTSARRLIPPEPLARETIETLLSLASSRTERGHILFSFIQIRNEANLAIQDRGDSRNALLGAATAAEVFLDNVLSLLLWAEGTDDASAREIFDKKRLAQRVREEYHVQLRGNWSSGAVGQWRRFVADARNQVIHSGGLPDEVQARMALDAVEDLVSYVFDLLANSRVQCRYPKTSLLICGVPALERRGAVRQVVRELADEAPEALIEEAARYQKRVFSRA
jgi:hypothetical protein